METGQQIVSFPENTANQATCKPAHSRKLRIKPRNRRRAIDLTQAKLAEIKADFDVHPNSQDVAQDHLLPRAEAVDAVLSRLGKEVFSIRQEFLAEMCDLRRALGMGGPQQKPFLVARRAA